MSDEGKDLPAPPDAADRPRVGVDEWVERVAGSGESGWQGELRARLERVPTWAKLPFLVLPIALFPLFTNSGYLMQVGIDTLIFMLLALGLNVAVGWAGLLDLGYIAFFGFGAYGYAMLASGQFGVHWQAQWVIPVVVAATVLLGFLVGLPSRRLVGDYLAIVTLFFLQLFLTILLNADRLTCPSTTARSTSPAVRTGSRTSTRCGSSAGGRSRSTTTSTSRSASSSLVFVGLAFVNSSRTGRAWRALREDPLAAELMSMPVNRLKLLAFAFGAGVAGLTGNPLRRVAGRRLPGQLRPAAADHALRDGHPRRLRQPPGRRDRGDRDQRLARSAAHARGRELDLLRSRSSSRFRS